MSTIFSLTARDMVTQAMRELGVLPSGEDPEAAELTDGLVRLNSLLKSLAAKGLNLWRDSDGSVTFPAGTATMAITPAATSVSDTRLVNSDGTERTLGRWEADDYSSLPVKAIQGTPSVFVIGLSSAGTTMTLWPVPSLSTTIHYSYGRVTADVDASDPIDVPQMFQETIWTMLAVRIAPMFGKARTDPATVQMVAARAAELERDMLDYDRPAIISLGPDLDGYP